MSNLTFKKDTHTYLLGNKKLISVSKILNNYFGESYKDVPKNILQAAANRGNAVHKVLELYFKNINSLDILFRIKNLIKFKKTFTETILNYCHTALDYADKQLKNIVVNDSELIIEQPFAYDIVAGTPDLVINNNLLIDYKTYKTMTKQLRLKAELQLTAYYWLLLKNGIKLSKNSYILWIKESTVEIIQIQVTEAKIHEWEMAIALYKENILKDGKENESSN